VASYFGQMKNVLSGSIFGFKDEVCFAILDNIVKKFSTKT